MVTFKKEKIVCEFSEPFFSIPRTSFLFGCSIEENFTLFTLQYKPCIYILRKPKGSLQVQQPHSNTSYLEYQKLSSLIYSHPYKSNLTSPLPHQKK